MPTRADYLLAGFWDDDGTGTAVMGRDTKQEILRAAVELIDARGAERVTVDEVLIAADASASSLYHHFGNREGLLAAVEAERYRRGWSGQRRRLQEGEDASTPEEFLAYIESEIRRIATDPETAATRRKRLEVAARAIGSPELAASKSALQAQVVDALGAMFESARQRGLINADLDARAYGAWYSGMLLGRVFTEDGTLDAEAWLSVALPAALAPLRHDPPS